MKRTKILTILLVGVIAPLSVGQGKPEEPGPPPGVGNPLDAVWDALDAVWDALDEVWDEINDIWLGQADLQDQIANMQLIPGPQGPQGEQGPKGDKGDPGETPWQKNNSEIYYNAGNVGIGTTNPDVPLQIGGGTHAPTFAGTALQMDYDDSSQHAMEIHNNSGSTLLSLNPDGSTSLGALGADNDLHLGGGGTVAMSLTAAGNVGIGTSSPDSKLEVRGSSIDPLMYCENSGQGQAVFGLNKGWGEGVWGYSESGDGVYGRSGSGNGVVGWSTNTGVYGFSSGAGKGVYGESDSGYGVYGYSNTGYAGYFGGNVHVTGSINKSACSFKIDHPLDPENKYLSHSVVESPDMMNIYNGNVTLDENGQATVQLPEYFEALNCDFRYQLTAIGAPGPNLYIAEKIVENRFTIAGGKAGMEVSWQVTGIREDPYAVANPIQVEEDKADEERGLYLHPQAYGLPEEQGIQTIRNPRRSRTEEVVERRKLGTATNRVY